MTEEIWQSLNPGATSLHKEAWPSYDETKVISQKLTIAVQVGGKLRGTVEIEAENSKDQAQIEEKAKADLNISKYLSGKEIKKVIYVQDKILSFVLQN
jgi:leucyl-tRNA synthetase